MQYGASDTFTYIINFAKVKDFALVNFCGCRIYNFVSGNVTLRRIQFNSVIGTVIIKVYIHY